MCIYSLLTKHLTGALVADLLFMENLAGVFVAGKFLAAYLMRVLTREQVHFTRICPKRGGKTDRQTDRQDISAAFFCLICCRSVNLLFARLIGYPGSSRPIVYSPDGDTSYLSEKMF